MPIDFVNRKRRKTTGETTTTINCQAPTNPGWRLLRTAAQQHRPVQADHPSNHLFFIIVRSILLIRTKKKERLDYNRNDLIASVITGSTGEADKFHLGGRESPSRWWKKKQQHFHLLDDCYLFHFANNDVAKIPSEQRVKCIEMIENTRGAQLFWVDNKEDKNSISLDG